MGESGVEITAQPTTQHSMQTVHRFFVTSQYRATAVYSTSLVLYPERTTKQGMQDAEMRGEWSERLQNIFPYVSKGSNITAVKDNTGKTHFYYDGRACGTVSGSKFSNRFFDI